MNTTQQFIVGSLIGFMISAAIFGPLLFMEINHEPANPNRIILLNCGENKIVMDNTTIYCDISDNINVKENGKLNSNR